MLEEIIYFWRWSYAQILILASSCYLFAVIEGLGSIFGEFLYDYYGISNEQKLMSLIKEACTSLLIGSFLGITFDLVYVFFFNIIFVRSFYLDMW